MPQDRGKVVVRDRIVGVSADRAGGRQPVEERDRRPAHRPWNSGSRFSMNARTPSVKSSVRSRGSSWRNT